MKFWKTIKLCVLFLLMLNSLTGQVMTIDSHIVNIKDLFKKYDETEDLGLLISIAYNLPSYVSIENYHGDENWKFNRETVTKIYIKYFNELINSGFDLNIDPAKIYCFRWSIVIAGTKEELRNVEIQRKNNEYFCYYSRILRSLERAKNKFNCFYKYHYKRRGDNFKNVLSVIDDYSKEYGTENMDIILKLLKESKRRLCWGRMRYE